MADNIVFAGPCLAGVGGARWQKLLDSVEVRPPARRGDLRKVLGERPKVLVLLDGYYYSVPAVTHKEILYALQAGVRMVGAASLGALRAAELEGEGMVGVGRVFEWYREGRLEGDDEVALLHADEAFDYRPLTLPLVELRLAVEDLVEAGGISPDDGRALVEAVKPLPFLERYWEPKIRRAAEEILGPGATLALDRRLENQSAKTRDARQAIERALELAAAPAGEPNPGPLTHISSYHRELYTDVSLGDGPRIRLESCWRMVQLLHPQATDFVRKVRIRQLLVCAASLTGLEPSTASTTSLADTLEDRARISGIRLPGREIEEEALHHALALAARQHFASTPALGELLARRLPLRAEPSLDDLLELFESYDELLPNWFLVRAFAFTPAFRPARWVAAQAQEIARAFRGATPGMRIRSRELQSLATELWDCGIDDVTQEAARRGLFHPRPYGSGLLEILGDIAAAERLPESVNDYPEARRQLRRSALTYPLESGHGLQLLDRPDDEFVIA